MSNCLQATLDITFTHTHRQRGGKSLIYYKIFPNLESNLYAGQSSDQTSIIKQITGRVGTKLYLIIQPPTIVQSQHRWKVWKLNPKYRAESNISV